MSRSSRVPVLSSYSNCPIVSVQTSTIMIWGKRGGDWVPCIAELKSNQVSMFARRRDKEDRARESCDIHSPVQKTCRCRPAVRARQSVTSSPAVSIPEAVHLFLSSVRDLWPSRRPVFIFQPSADVRIRKSWPAQQDTAKRCGQGIESERSSSVWNTYSAGASQLLHKSRHGGRMRASSEEVGDMGAVRERRRGVVEPVGRSRPRGKFRRTRALGAATFGRQTRSEGSIAEGKRRRAG